MLQSSRIRWKSVRLFLVHAEGALGLVEDAVAGAAVHTLVLAAAEGVGGLLAGRLVLGGLAATVNLLINVLVNRTFVWWSLPSHLVANIGDVLLELVRSGLGGVGLNTLLELCCVMSEVVPSKDRELGDERIRRRGQ